VAVLKRRGLLMLIAAMPGVAVKSMAGRSRAGRFRRLQFKGACPAGRGALPWSGGAARLRFICL